MAFRTDLAMECCEPHLDRLPEGVSHQECTLGKLHIDRVKVTSQKGADLIGKPIGEYVTVTLPEFSGPIEADEEEIAAIGEEIAQKLPKEGLVLVVGLGNNDITPDAIGPRTVRQVLATRHIKGELAKSVGLDHLRPTAAIAPGVLGQTGIETSEIISSVAGDIEPAAVIVIDALAARSTSRLGNTIQISNSGISPGSGVMNARKELSRESLGFPVISIGIPTVVDAATLASDLLEADEETLDKLRQLFSPRGNELMVTPRDIDQLIGRACHTLSLAVNKALQPDMSLEEIGYLVS